MGGDLREAIEALTELREYAASVWFDEASATDEEHDIMGRARKALAIIALIEGREGWRPTHRHVKRGSTYQVIGEASLQIERPAVLGDYAPLVVYRDSGGALWARPPVEFSDGRFEPLPDPPRNQPIEGNAPGTSDPTPETEGEG